MVRSAGADAPRLSRPLMPIHPHRLHPPQVMGYLARPNAVLRALTTTLHEDLRLPGGGCYAAVHVRFGDKKTEAWQHNISEYVAVLRNASRGANWTTVLLSSDDAAPYKRVSRRKRRNPARFPCAVTPPRRMGAPSAAQMPDLMPELKFTWVPFELFVRGPLQGATVAAKVVEQKYDPSWSRRFGQRRPKIGGVRPDEGLVLLATAQLMAQARVIVGTLTSNYGLLLHDLAERHWGDGQSDFRDLDGTVSHHRTSRREPPCLNLGTERRDTLAHAGNSYYPCNVRVEPPFGPRYGRPSASGDIFAAKTSRRMYGPWDVVGSSAVGRRLGNGRSRSELQWPLGSRSDYSQAQHTRRR